MKNKIMLTIIIALLVLPVYTAYAENPIGILLEGYEKSCTVHRKGFDGTEDKIKCEYKMELFEGDIIVKSPTIEAIDIKWESEPYTGPKILSDTSLEVVYNPPEDKKGIRSLIKPFLTFIGLWESPHIDDIAASRGTPDETQEFEDKDIIPRPGYFSTVLPGHPTTFAWGKEGGEAIVFCDSNGNTIFQRNLHGQEKVELTPEEIGMKPFETYRWSVEGIGSYRLHRITLLRDEITQQIIDDLKEIENQDIEENGKRIQKSAYLQLMSDMFPDEISLYWMSYDIVKGVTNNTQVDKLKQKYFTHLKDKE